MYKYTKKIMWKQEDLDFIKKNFQHMSDIELSADLGKSIKSVQSKARRLNLKKEPTHIKKINKFRVDSRWGEVKWTKDEIDFLTTNINSLTNKEISRKLNRSEVSVASMGARLNLKREKKYTKEFLERECLKYITKKELSISDPNLYAWLYKNGKMSDFSKHMMNISYSTPQLILKSVLSKLIKSNFTYNDRKAISPYEIDIFYPKEKVGFEYDGIYYHQNGTKFKLNVCEQRGINLIIIDEKQLSSKNFDGYLLNIKNQIINNLTTINHLFGLNIDGSDVLSIYPNKNDVFKGLINIEKLRDICNKYDNYSEFIKNEKICYNKLYYLGLLKDFTKHMKVDSTLENLVESKNFYKIGDKILIEYWYNDMITCVMIKDIVGRKYKVTHNIPESKIFNAPDEIIKSSHIIDIYRELDNSKNSL